MDQSVLERYGGTIQPVTAKCSHNVLLRAHWPNGISLQVVELAGHSNIFICRSDEVLFRMILRRDEIVEDVLERTARKISQGGYDRQKTAKQRAAYLVKRDQLVSCMNQTKWMELRRAMKEEMPFPPAYTFKLLDEPDSPENGQSTSLSFHGGDWEPEFLLPSMLVLVEWLKIDPRLAKSRGRLVEPEIIDARKPLREILTRCSIPYEEHDPDFIIYGYRRSVRL